jgi:hypothetical protein
MTHRSGDGRLPRLAVNAPEGAGTTQTSIDLLPPFLTNCSSFMADRPFSKCTRTQLGPIRTPTTLIKSRFLPASSQAGMVSAEGEATIR